MPDCLVYKALTLEVWEQGTRQCRLSSHRDVQADGSLLGDFCLNDKRVRDLFTVYSRNVRDKAWALH